MGDQPSTPHFVFPRAQQAQIIRANQRDLYHVSRLREQAASVLRYWLGSRWLARWDKELDLLVKLFYFGLTSGRGTQTLGEEYTDIWQYSSFTRALPPSLASRAALVAISLLPPYILGRWGQNASFNETHPIIAKWLRRITTAFDIAVEINLATFYIKGTYYDALKRFMGIQHLSSHPPNPHTRPPSYSLLGVMIAIRMLYRLVAFIRHQFPETPSGVKKGKERAETSSEMYIDDRPVSSLLDESPEKDLARPVEDNERMALDISAIPAAIRSSRKCTLCLEERTDSCATECGHLFCWNCIVGWGRERAECPLCRQSLSLKKLLPIYNL